MKRTLAIVCVALFATAAFAAGETVELPDGTTMEVLYPGVDGVTRPVAKKNERVVPEYPPIASPLNAESNVVFAVLVGADGKAVQLLVREATHPGMGFEDAAAKALFQWEFEPAELDGQPVASYTNIRVRFPDQARRSRSSLVGGLPSGASGGGSTGMIDHRGGSLFADHGVTSAMTAGTDKGARAGGPLTTSSTPQTRTLSRTKIDFVAPGQLYFRGHSEWGYRRYNDPPRSGELDPR